MQKPLKLLIIEDSDYDAEMIVRLLKKSGYDVAYERVEEASQMQKALKSQDWDLIISDHNMPQFNSQKALLILLESGKDVPFIIVSGSIGEETAVAAMKAGAQDYLLKNDLARLVPAVERELDEAKNRKERKIAEKEFHKSEEKFRAIVETISDVIWESDNQGYLNYVSPHVEKILGYTPEEMIGKRIFDFLAPEEAQKMEEEFFRFVSQKKAVQGFENKCCSKDGRFVPMELNTVLIFDQNGDVIGLRGTNRDISERKKAEDMLRRSLNEKEVLLQELYHRTKNNMQVICSILSLQASYSQDDKIKAVLKDQVSRIQSMALVHKKLYQSQDLSSLNLKDYIVELCNLLIKSYSEPFRRINLVLELDDVDALIDTAVPCGLILNELMMNSLKHGFPDGRDGEIRVLLKKETDGKVLIQVSDNGVGVPPDFDFRTNMKMGLLSIFSIAEKQLQGEISFENQQGITCKMKFINSIERKRV